MRHRIWTSVVLSILLTSAVDVVAQTAAANQDARFTVVQPATTVVRDAAVREAVRLGSMRQQTVPPTSDRSWPGRHPVLLGALVGLGAGIAFTAATADANNGCRRSSDYPCGQVALVLGGLGAGIGAGVGGIVALVRR